ncbi:hypothetical protein Aasi_0765 [Candidatus Amoebophilus asiaticus 5a2]|uniref:Outer membrane protein beta-barrel domain-containing protein n=1 Tax=Amoebophilus asiaticus (strain 5a2) TaxID=452471 RepID=B3ESE3_AMOA5|nr:hypothetical protein [Candidatus Amoebophilus asiaticus]ACE06145.1 hypothetical protein Aasi_0765 [Candidatus Amoebophilus asiaticus 5a2]
MKKTLIRNLTCAWLFLLLPAYTWAQATNQDPQNKDSNGYDYGIKDEDEFQPEIPLRYTSLVLDFGIANFIRVPEHMDLTFWGSRTLDGSLYYNIPIGKSHFMVSCGLGIANTDYTFKSTYTMTRTNDTDRKTKMEAITKVIDIKSSKDIKNSMFSIYNAKLALEFRFNSNKEEPQEGFFIAIGGDIGFQFSPSTKISYEEDKENKVHIIKERFNFNKVHYGALARIGWHRFGLFYHQTLSPVFNPNKGPEVERILPFSVGISFNLL